MNNITIGALAVAIATSPLAAQWAQMSPTASPPTLAGACMATGPTGNLVLFGGDSGAGPFGSPTNNTWTYDGSTWTQLAPTMSPPNTVLAELVYDSNRGVFVTYGGGNTSPFGGSSVDKTWEFDGTNWTQIFPVNTPGGLGLYGMCFDSARNKTVLYGGQVNGGLLIISDSTYEYDGTDWSLVTTATSPGPLEGPAMCFHAGIGKTVMWGGIDPQVGGVDTTWLFDGTDWTAAPVAGVKPAPRSRPKMAYDSVRGVCVMTGGSDPMTGANIVDTWEFDGTSWTQVPTATSGRVHHTLAFMPNRRQMVQYGGIDFTTFTYLGDTREYGARSRSFGSGCAGTAGVPTLTATDAPRLGSTYSLTLTNLVPSIPVTIFVVGLSDTNGSLGALPLNLDSFGLIGCTQYASDDVIAFMGASSGSATLSTSLPNDVGFMGVTLFHQGISLDPTANLAGATVSNGHAGVVGR